MATQLTGFRTDESKARTTYNCSKFQVAQYPNLDGSAEIDPYLPTAAYSSSVNASLYCTIHTHLLDIMLLTVCQRKLSTLQTGWFPTTRIGVFSWQSMFGSQSESEFCFPGQVIPCSPESISGALYFKTLDVNDLPNKMWNSLRRNSSLVCQGILGRGPQLVQLHLSTQNESHEVLKGSRELQHAGPMEWQSLNTRCGSAMFCHVLRSLSFYPKKPPEGC